MDIEFDCTFIVYINDLISIQINIIQTKYVLMYAAFDIFRENEIEIVNTVLLF